MRLLILTQYYPPEIGAPQNRLHELAVRLQKNGLHVEVLTAMPNYPSMEIHVAYRNGKIKEEIIDDIIIHRARIFVSRSKSIFIRLLNYFSFVFTSIFRGRKLENFDYLMVESPPLFLGYSALFLSKKLKAKLIFNVSDLWPESAEKLGLVTNKTFLKLAYKLESRCYNSAHLITGQTQGIVADIASRFPHKKVIWLPNGVDLDYYNPDKISANGFRIQNGFNENQLLFFYGGVVGYAQGLDIILHAAKFFDSDQKIQFIIQGAGPELERLQLLKLELGINNVHFLPPVSKADMPSVLKEVNVAIIPLRNLTLFTGAIPSKVFETLAMEIPILLGVDGEARTHFVDKAKAALFVEPENTQMLIAAIQQLIDNPNLGIEMGKNGRKYAMETFNRNKIAQDFLIELKALSQN